MGASKSKRKTGESKPSRERNERSTLLKLMGFPSPIGDSNDEADELEPDWNAVSQYLQSNPNDDARKDASICEDGEYPLDDALWIQSDPVPASIVIRLLRLYPLALTTLTFRTASGNPTVSSDIKRLLAGADVRSLFTKQRSTLVTLMGYPPLTTDNDYEQQHVKPDWEKVRKRLLSHPEEARIHENGTYPLADALWIESDPVPLDVVATLVQLCHESLTDEAFLYASQNNITRIGSNVDIIRYMFNCDALQHQKQQQQQQQQCQTEVKHEGDSGDDGTLENKNYDDQDLLGLKSRRNVVKAKSEAEINVAPSGGQENYTNTVLIDQVEVEVTEAVAEAVAVAVAVDSDVAVATAVPSTAHIVENLTLNQPTSQSTDYIPDTITSKPADRIFSNKSSLADSDYDSNYGNRYLRYGDVVYIISDNDARLDIGEGALKRNTPANHSSPTTRLIIDGPLGGDTSRSGPIREGDVFGIYSEDKTLRLDICPPSTKMPVSVSHNSWASNLCFAPAMGENKQGQIINYGEKVGIFSSTSFRRLDIGLDAVLEVAEASRNSSGTQLRACCIESDDKTVGSS